MLRLTGGSHSPDLPVSQRKLIMGVSCLSFPVHEIRTPLKNFRTSTRCNGSIHRRKKEELPRLGMLLEALNLRPELESTIDDWILRCPDVANLEAPKRPFISCTYLVTKKFAVFSEGCIILELAKLARWSPTRLTAPLADLYIYSTLANYFYASSTPFSSSKKGSKCYFWGDLREGHFSLTRIFWALFSKGKGSGHDLESLRQ
ncbi:hypothetical protein DFH27DRAFT_604067 [Peziza echinospora]|nr:hypothetical protein DFH27DRAFT_604067 [Peziza echinospora]